MKTINPQSPLEAEIATLTEKIRLADAQIEKHKEAIAVIESNIDSDRRVLEIRKEQLTKQKA